jgi:hypothetical protein
MARKSSHSGHWRLATGGQLWRLNQLGRLQVVDDGQSISAAEAKMLIEAELKTMGEPYFPGTKGAALFSDAESAGNQAPGPVRGSSLGFDAILDMGPGGRFLTLNSGLARLDPYRSDARHRGPPDEARRTLERREPAPGARASSALRRRRPQGRGPKHPPVRPGVPSLEQPDKHPPSCVRA